MGMVKSNALLYITTLTLLLSACCKSDDESEAASVRNDYFTAIIEPYGNPDKTYIETGSGHDYCCWSNGDRVNINGTLREVTVNGSAGNYTALIQANDIPAEAGGFLAAYPGDDAMINDGTVTFTIPTTSEYRAITSGAGSGMQIVDAPMVTFTTERTLQFKNLGALLLFHLKVEGSGQIALQRISVSSDQPLCGNYSVSREGDGWTRDASALNGTLRSLECSEAESLGTAPHPFYLYLPPVENASTFHIDIQLSVNGVRRHFVKTKSGDIDLAASTCYDFGTLTYNTTSSTLIDNNNVTYEEVEPAGTESDPYLIGNTAEWIYWCNKYATVGGKQFRMDGDIAVANAIDEFNGTLDGDGHTVTLNNCALIAYLNGGTVTNVTTRTDEAISTSNYTVPNTSRKAYGTIAAYAANATLTHCTNQADITQSATANTFDVGGIVGYVDNPDGTLINGCSNEGDIDCMSANTTFNAGGIIGTTSRFSTHLVNCCNLGTISHSVSTENTCHLGGLVGFLGGVNNIIENSYSVGAVSGDASDMRGGITSQMGSGGTLQNCYCYSADATLNLCQTNSVNGVIRFCYHYGTNTITSGNAATNCSTLANATTINREAPNHLATQLNSNIIMLSITNAWQWTETDGYTVLIQPSR